MAQAEATQNFFLAQTLESTRTVPMVSAELPIADEATDEVVGSFVYRGIVYAMEPGGESVAVVAVDRAKLSQDLLEAQAVVLPSEVPLAEGGSCRVTRIADGAFSGLGAASQSTATEDGASADASITAVTIPASITSIGDEAFIGSDALRTVVVSSDNPNYSMYDGCLYDKPMTSLLLIPGGRLGAVRVASQAESFPTQVLSHCAATGLIADAGSTAFQALSGIDLHNEHGDAIELSAAEEGAEDVDAVALDYATSLLAEGEPTDQVVEGVVPVRESVRVAASNGSASIDDANRLRASTDVSTYEVLLRDAEDDALQVYHVLAPTPMVDGDADDPAVDELEGGLGEAGSAQFDQGESEPMQPGPDEEEVIEGGDFDDGDSFDPGTGSSDGLSEDAASAASSANAASSEDDATRPVSVSFAADLVTPDGVYMINRVAELTTSEAVPYAAANTGSAQIFGRSYRDAFLVVDPPKQIRAFLYADCDQPNGGFTGTVSWTGGDEEGPDEDSIVTVNVEKYVAAQSNQVTTLETLMAGKATAWGANSEKKLVGFRNRDTGSFLSLETIYSGEPFTFSYRMGTLGLPSEEGIFDGNAITDYGICHRGSFGGLAVDTGFDPVLNQSSSSVAIRFDPNGGKFTNGVTGHSYGGAAMTYSAAGGTLNTPVSPISRDEVVFDGSGQPILDENGLEVMKPMTFVGWFYRDNAGTELPAPGSAPAQPVEGAVYATTYYAKWESSTNTKSYEDAFLVFDPPNIMSAFLYADRDQPNGGFTGTVSWTGGDEEGPDEDSIVTVNVEKYVAAQNNQVTMLETLMGGKATRWGATSEKKLVGFRNKDTGSFLSLETIYSGEPFTFSYKMGTIRAPSSEESFNGNAITDYGVCHRGAVDDWSQDTGFEVVFESSASTVAIRFSPNGGKFTNSVTGHSYGGVAMTYSNEGEVLNTPTSPISKDEVVEDVEGNQISKPMTFVGWFYRDSSGNEVPAPGVAPPQPAGGICFETTYYAKWESSTNTKRYEDAFLVVDLANEGLAFLYADRNQPKGGFTGVVSWTGGDERGPNRDSIITVNVERYVAAQENSVTMLETFMGGKAVHWGSNSRDRLVGFRNVDTGSFLSLETMYSGEPFTFSYKMGDVLEPTQEGYFDGNALTNYGVCHRGAVGAWRQDTGFEAVFERSTSSVAIRFDPNGGKFTNGVTGHTFGGAAMTYSTAGGVLNTPTSPISNGTKTFLGWFEANADGSFKLDSSGNKILASGIAPAQPADGSISPVIYKADWADSTITWYTIDYDKNAEAATGETYTTYMYLHGPSYLAGNGFANTGYTFREWNTAPDGSGISFAADTEAVKEDFVGSTIHAGDALTLYAIWDAHRYTAAFEKGEGDSRPVGGGAAPAPIVCTYDETANAPLAYAVSDCFERKGYGAAAWQVVAVTIPAVSEDEEDEVREVTDGAVVGVGEPILNLTDIDGAIVTLVPCWTLDEYAITIDKNDGNYVATFPDGEPASTYRFVEEPSESTDYSIAIPVPKRAGYAFTGWERTDTDGTMRESDTIDPTQEVGDFTFRATWAPVLSVDLPIEASSSAAFVIDAATGRTQDQLEGVSADQTVRIKSANAVDTHLSVRSEEVDGTDLTSLFAPRNASVSSADIAAFVSTVGFMFSPVAGGNLLADGTKASLALLHANDQDSGLIIRGSEGLLEEKATDLRYIDADGVLALACRQADGTFGAFQADVTKLSIATDATPFDFSKLIWTVSLSS